MSEKNAGELNGFYGKKHSEDALQLMGLKPVILEDIDTGELKQFNSTKQAADWLGITRQSVGETIRNGGTIAKRYKPRRI